MITPLHWIEIDLPGRLAIAPRPRGGDWLADEIAAWSREDVTVVVSLLESEEVTELELTHESELCAAAGIELIPLPIPDRRDVRHLTDPGAWRPPP